MRDDENDCNAFQVKFGREPTLRERQWAFKQAPFGWGDADDPQAFPVDGEDGWWEIGNA